MLPLLLVAVTIISATPGLTRTAVSAADQQPAPPYTAAFFYPWFPRGWHQGSPDPYTNFQPSLGLYDSRAPATIDDQLRLARRAHLKAFISSWWGRNDLTDRNLAVLLRRTAASGSPYSALRWAVYYEAEGSGDPTPEAIAADLDYLGRRYFGQQAYLRVSGKPVVFVYADGHDGQGMVDRWRAARRLYGKRVYLVLKVFPGYEDARSGIDSWHQYGPASGYQEHLPYSAALSPGFWKAGEAPRLGRNPDRFRADLRRMVESKATWQLVTTWNEWGEGTAVEPAREFGTSYIEALHDILPAPVTGTRSRSGAIVKPR